MTPDPPPEHSGEVRAALREIVSEFGASALSEPQTMSNLLMDLMPEAPRERGILIAAAGERLADELRDHVSAGLGAAAASRLTAASFAARTMFSREACSWVVSELAIALGLDTRPAEVSTISTRVATGPNSGIADSGAPPGAGERGSDPAAARKPTRVATPGSERQVAEPAPAKAAARQPSASPARRRGAQAMGVLVIAVVIAVVVLALRNRPAKAPAASLGHSSSPASSSPRTSGPSRGNPAPSTPPTPGPRLSSQSYASYAFQVWPGPVSATGRAAEVGLAVTVRRQGTGILVSAGVRGQPAPSGRYYPTGVTVYIIEASMGDDSAGIDYNLGDDGLVVTDSAGRILQ